VCHGYRWEDETKARDRRRCTPFSLLTPGVHSHPLSDVRRCLRRRRCYAPRFGSRVLATATNQARWRAVSPTRTSRSAARSQSAATASLTARGWFVGSLADVPATIVAPLVAL
jgi:hypothetical protein